MRYVIIYTMKYALAFCLGIITHAYVFPSSPSVDMDSVTQEIIIQDVLERLEDNGYDIRQARRDVKRGWFD